MKKIKSSPYVTIIISFFLVILIGSLLLMLPISITEAYKQEIGKNHLSFIDALFTSTTSVCVTGLTVIPNIGTSLTMFGKIIMVILIEIGGLSILTIGIFVFTILGVKLSIADRFMMKEALNQNSVSGIIRLVRYIIIITISFQAISAVFNFFILYFATNGWTYGVLDTIGISIFHAISSFNNAGLDIFGFDNSLCETMFNNNILLNLNTMISIIVGGIGFIVIYDIIRYPKTRRLTLHSKIVIPTTICLIVVGTVLLLLVDRNINFLQALFQSVSARTAGFASYPTGNFDTPARLVLMCLMLIGASPCSTGGGLKTTTIFVVIIFIIAFARGKPTKYCNRQISTQSLFKVFSLISFVIFYLTFAIFILSIIEKDLSLSDIAFESISAFSTTGLSTGITTSLKPISRIIIVVTMFLGRIGPLTVASLLNRNWIRSTNDDIQYIEEKIIIG